MNGLITFVLIVLLVGCGDLAQAESMPERQISEGSDDAEEDVIPSTVTYNNPLWACCNCPASGYLCHITGAGLRFTDVQIPQGAAIDSAWLTILPFIITNDDIACTVYCEDVDNCTTFVTANFHNVSNRDRTSSKITWCQRDAGSDWVSSCNLADVVREVVNRPGWVPGNALAFILIPGDSAGEWRSNLQFQAWEIMDHSYGAKFNCIYTSSDSPDEEEIVGPIKVALSQNHPNPFNQETEIEFALASPGLVSLDIFDLLGRKVRCLVSEHLSSGSKWVLWDGKNDSGTDVSSGIYFCRMKVGGSTETKKLVLLK
jgi:hypothetical protein